MSEGTTDIRDKAHQQQDISDLSRDPEHAANGLSAIFDKEKEQKRLQQGQLIGEIGTQVSDIVRTQGELAGLKAGKDPAALDAARKQLAEEGKTFTDSDVAKRAYDNAMKPFGTGSDLQRGLQAATAAIQGLAGGDWKAAAAGAAAPYIANVIGNTIPEGNLAGRTIAHAVVNAVLAAAQGSKGAGIAAGAAGAATGEVMGALLADQIYGRKPSELTESEKQTVSALATAAAGLAGGLAGDSTGNALAGAQAGKTTVENNLLGGNEETQTKFVQEHGKDIASCSANPGGAACQRGQAMNDALMVALPAGLGGGMLAAATPEIAAAAKTAIQACAGNVVLCLNNAGIQMSEAVVPGGVGAGGAVGIGETASEAAAAKAEAAAANAAKGSGSSIGSATKVTINQGQQNKHILGSNEYKIASEAGQSKSILTVNPETLLSKLGTGQQVGKTSIGAPGSKERINYGKIIGNYIDPQTGVSTPTTNGIVHYGKNGVHIVPARPSE